MLVYQRVDQVSFPQLPHPPDVVHPVPEAMFPGECARLWKLMKRPVFWFTKIRNFWLLGQRMSNVLLLVTYVYLFAVYDLTGWSVCCDRLKILENPGDKDLQPYNSGERRVSRTVAHVIFLRKKSWKQKNSSKQILRKGAKSHLNNLHLTWAVTPVVSRVFLSTLVCVGKAIPLTSRIRRVKTLGLDWSFNILTNLGRLLACEVISNFLSWSSALHKMQQKGGKDIVI